MTQRHSHLAHWGAFTAVVEDGRLVRCEPFEADPQPSAILDSVAPMVYSDTRIRRPSIRRSWLAQREKSDGSLRGREDFVEVGWDEALDLVAGEVTRVRAEHGAQGIFGGFYGWSSAGRFHHARTQVRRFYYNGGGCADQTGNYSRGTAQFLLPHIIGTYAPLTGRVTSWPSILHPRQGVRRLRRPRAQERPDGCRRRGAAHAGALAARAGPLGHQGVQHQPDEGRLPRLRWRRVDPHPPQHRRGADARAGARDLPPRRGRPGLPRALLHRPRTAARLHRRRERGMPKTAEWASGITGIPPERIRALAASLCGVRSYMTSSFAVQRQHRGEQPYWMLIALTAILGQVGLPGAASATAR